MKNKTKIAIYGRVSTEMENQHLSYTTQTDLNSISGYDSAKHLLVATYSDKGTGTKFTNRPEFLKMLEDAGLDISKARGSKLIFTASNRKSKFNEIWVTNSSRVARNTQIIDIIDELKSKGVYIEFKDLNISTRNEEQELILNLLITLDKQFSKDVSKKVELGNRRSALATNRVHTNSKIYGYTYIKEENRLEIIPKEAKIIKLVFELYVNGLNGQKFGERRIANYINNLGYRNREDGEFSAKSISNIIKQVKYTGQNVRGIYESKKVFTDVPTRRREVPISIKDSKGKIPIIIPVELFEQAQKQRKANTDYTKGTNAGFTKYAGKVKCSICGANYNRNTLKKKYKRKDGSVNEYIQKYYSCQSKRKGGVKACDSTNISEDKLDKAMKVLASEFTSHLDKYLDDIEPRVIKELETTREELLGVDSKAKKDSLREELKTIQDKQDRLMDLFLDGNLSKGLLERKQEQLEQEIQRIKEDIRLIDNSLKRYNEQKETIGRYFKYAEWLMKKYSNGMTIEELLQEIEYISIVEGEISEVVYKYGIALNRII